VNQICQRIQEEQDPVEFQRLVVELPDLLERVAHGTKAEFKPNW
jgi:hypothetical protein